MECLEGIGDWMHYNSRSIHGGTQAPDEFACPENCKLTYNPDTRRLYVHLLQWPYKHLFLDGQAFVDQVDYAQFLHDASEIRFSTSAEGSAKNTLSGSTNPPNLRLHLPQNEPRGEIPVIELFLK